MIAVSRNSGQLQHVVLHAKQDAATTRNTVDLHGPRKFFMLHRRLRDSEEGEPRFMISVGHYGLCHIE